MAPAISSVAVPKIPITTQAADPSASPATPLRGSRKSPSTLSKPAEEAMTVTDPETVSVQARAAEMTAAPAWVELQRPTLRTVDLLAVKDLTQFVAETRDQYRLSYLANAQIPPSRYSLTFISLAAVRNLVISEYNIQKAMQPHEQDALQTIASRFKQSGKAKSIEQKRIDDALLLAAEKRTKAAALRKQQRQKAAARKTVADTLAGIVVRRRHTIQNDLRTALQLSPKGVLR
ncbi:hypothetical protein T492DRAFT_834708 [Pavlovales sp. CCMP2436]|nr:hypothetical protein T492DRAFT_834708 [Pavlovales sp. CCMP2436]